MTIEAAPLESPPSRPRGAPYRWIALGAVVIALVTAVTLLPSGDDAGGATGSDPGSVAPDFVVTDLRATAGFVRLADARGTPVVLNFFAAWCTPCRKEMPTLQAAAKRFEGKVAFIGIDHKDSRSEALDLLAATGVDYPTGFDQKGEVLRNYGLPDALPITIFLDADGTVVERKLGEMSAKKLDDAIDRLLAG